MRITDTSDLWWKTTVIYCLDVETFLDWNDDGVGDFEGLAHRMDYLHDLGITCLWLMPFYPSPNRDDGYDVADYYDVDPRLGDLGDVVEMIRMANDRGIRVIIDLVVNHTSDRHPWFERSRSSRDDPYRTYYVWRDAPSGDEPPAFPGAEDSIWQLDTTTGQYYRHHFYRFQPDLNVSNPRVRDEIIKVMGFWLQLGVSGFRVDAVPFLVRAADADGVDEVLLQPLDLLKKLRAFLGRRAGDALMLGEANLPRDEQFDFFGGRDGDGLAMQFDFITMENMYLAFVRHDPAPLVAALASRPALAEQSQWANFLRNHDELTLDRLTAEEREEVFEAFAPDPATRIFGRGIIRRLPPMLGGDPRRIRMAYSLLFSLPGTPVLFYGEEIGMGDATEIGDRRAVRTPMQWRSGATGGFSNAPLDRLVRAPVSGGYGPEHINVDDQRHDAGSLLRFVGTLIAHYRESPEMGWGAFELLPHEEPAVLAHSLSGPEGRMVAVHNFADTAASLSIRIPGATVGCRLIDVLTDGVAVPVGEHGDVELRLEGYGFGWFRVIDPADRRLA